MRTLGLFLLLLSATPALATHRHPSRAQAEKIERTRQAAKAPVVRLTPPATVPPLAAPAAGPAPSQVHTPATTPTNGSIVPAVQPGQTEPVFVQKTAGSPASKRYYDNAGGRLKKQALGPFFRPAAMGPSRR
jgi:hypothetical protein